MGCAYKLFLSTNGISILTKCILAPLVSCSFILTFFYLTCYISVNRISSIRAHALISTRPRVSAHAVGHYQTSALSPPHNFLK